MDLLVPRHWLGHAGPGGSDTNRASLHDGSARSLKPRFSVSDLCASRYFQFGDAPHGWNLTAHQITIQVFEVILKIIHRISLRQVIREFLQVADPEPLILPIHISKAFHVCTLYENCALGNAETSETKGLTQI